MPQKQPGPIDRLPIICAAGKESKFSESVGNLFKEYHQEEFAEKLVKENSKLWKPIEPAAPILPENDRLKYILAPDLNKSRFMEFRDQFYENLYCKKVPLGKPSPANSKPEHVTNENVTFGKISTKSEKVYDLALPNRSPKEVLEEFVKWHHKYRLSHGSYFPSEQVNRGYSKHFDRNQVFGEIKNADASGKQVKIILQGSPSSSKIHIISKAQEEYNEQHKSSVGKPLQRQQYGLHPDTTFGRANRPDELNVKKLLKTTVTPEEASKYSNETTYRLFVHDLNNSLIDCRSPAGQTESQYPRKAECKFFAENLGEETTVKQLISPTIPSQFGLTHRDFFLPRSKDDIRRIFSKAGVDLSDEGFFEKVWSLALSEWTSIGNSASVEAFKYALDRITSKHDSI